MRRGENKKRGVINVACYHPSLGIPALRRDGKVKMLIQPLTDVSQLSQGWLGPDGKYRYNVAIPCGRCLGCRLDYAKEWSTRCCLEAEYYGYDNCCFLTLTYDQDHLPLRPMVVGCDSVNRYVNLKWIPQLVPADLRDWLKRLRRYYEYHYNVRDIRYYACGEYGTDTQRPHYHVILFGVRPAETWQSSTWCKRDGRGYYVWRADEIADKIWHNGNVIAGECNAHTIEYTARYMLKKQRGDDARYLADAHIQPPFVRASRRPAIGRRYLDDHAAYIYNYDEVYIHTDDGNTKRPVPKYYDRCMQDIDPDLITDVKARRAAVSYLSAETIDELSDVAYQDVLARRENIRKNRAKALDKREFL